MKSRGAWLMRHANFGLLGLGLARSAPGQVTEPIRVDFDAPAICGDGSGFLAAVRARTEAKAEERRLVVRITTGPSGYEGRLSVIEPGGESAERLIVAETCAEVVDALAIVAGYSLDPNGHEAAPKAAQSAETSPVPPPPPSAVAAQPVPAPEERPPAHEQSESQASEPLPISWFVGLKLGVQIATPDALVFPTGALTADFAWERRSVVSPTVQLGLGRTLEATASSASGNATFVLTTVRLEPCPIQVRLSPALRLVPCLVFDGGIVTAQGHNVTAERTETRPWWTAGVSARFPIGKGSPRVDLEAGVLAALYRDTFQFAPSEKIYQFSGPLPFVAAGIDFGHAAPP